MDELLREFLTETSESIDIVDAELVRFEQDPNNAKILGNIFRLVHTIKGTCGFLNLPRLEALTHAAEALIGKLRDGLPVTSEAVTLILATIDRIKGLLDELERSQAEPAGADRDLITAFDRMVQDNAVAGDADQPMQQAPPHTEQAQNKSTQPENTAPTGIDPSAETLSREDDHREGAIASDDHGFGAGAHTQPTPRHRAPSSGD
jgi:two-component system chemotaxis sensor kinase CheA